MARAQSGDAELLSEAKTRFKRSVDWESTARLRWQEDVKFVNGDPDNLYQWPDALRRLRGFGTQDERPTLTINKVRQHCLQIINDARQNKASIKVVATGNESSYEAAEVIEGICRHIEYRSDAQSVYTTAVRYQVWGGMGYWRVITDYIDPKSFDQEILIKRIKNPLSVYMDPDIQEADGSDARFAFVFDDVPKDQFDKRYPEYKDIASSAALDNDEGWMTEDHVRVAEYYRRQQVKTGRLIAYTAPESGQRLMMKEADIPAEIRDALLEQETTQVRDVYEDRVQWFKIVSDKVVDRRDWPGKYIPIVRVPGEETVIDSEMDRKGHVRALKDPQRMYNVGASGAVEYAAVQSRTPYVGPLAAFEGHESYWKAANIQNFAYLPFNHTDENGGTIPPPQRQEPPVAAPAFLTQMQTARDDMMMASGQYEASFGQKSNERSGVAITQRQREGDNATYHYIDHQAMAIRFTGKIIVDLIPKVYDTKRVMQILGEDGSESRVLIDPDAQQAYQRKKAQDKATADEVVLNPNIGTYDVEADVGPGFATQRQEAFNAFSQILAQNQELVTVVGDLMFKNADFPGADEMARRLERMVPAQAKGDGPPPEVQQLMAQNQSLQGVTQRLLQEMAGLQQQLKDKQEDYAIDWAQKQIDVHKAETARISSLQKAFQTDPEGIQALVRQMVAEALSAPMSVAPLPDPHPIMNPPPEADQEQQAA